MSPTNSAADLRAGRGPVHRRVFVRVLVVDNASTDDTREVAEDAGLDVISLEVNRGLAADNVGVGRTSGRASRCSTRMSAQPLRATSGVWRRSSRRTALVRWRRLSSCPTGLFRTPPVGSRARSTSWFAGFRAMTRCGAGDEPRGRRVDDGSEPGGPPVRLLRSAGSTSATSSISRVDLCVRLRGRRVPGSLRPDRSLAS